MGHHATRGTRFVLATTWLAFPWRWVAAFTIALVTRGRRFPMATAVLGAFAVGMGIVQCAAHGAWAGAVILSSLVVFGISSPLVDAAVGRASERAADRYAADHGLGPALAEALCVLHDGSARPSFLRRLARHHPHVGDRVEALHEYGVALPPQVESQLALIC